ncbi:glycosyltransferase family 2 protein [Marivirga sp. S37H4]|uniref:Glycosyltransferase family 2 protein n=1 Tax=Marivirga aurantiaca TaxID=2802615 RepID=A0A934X2C9_9BACT|nr:glycosyltransferase family 2 protein [Marivirga aurantiaca]MBK6267186.1 glycosyltransferase family 2 protein [Marivirga aurantiaca]
MKLSATVITFNEEANIERCLKSLEQVADEIVVVDSFSTDRTEKIACQFKKVLFIKNKFEGHVQQKNFAMEQSTFDYVLSLDADEELNPELQQHILRIKSSELEIADAYYMSRLNNYCGKWIRHGGWYPDFKIRLWNKSLGKWGGTNPHDKVILSENSTLQNLKGQILHYTYQNTEQHDRQIEKFTSIAAQESFRKNKRVFIISHLMLYPIISFIKVYIIKLGFMDGYYGLIIGLKHSRYKYLKYLKLYRLKKKATS